MTENDVKNLKEIREFLEKNNIKYSTKLDNFCLFYDREPEKRRYEIEYVSSLDFPIEYPKYDIKGVDKDYFYKKSREAEENNSFKMWIKDFEWNDDRKRPILKSQILHAYGITPNKFYARECIIKSVNTKEGRAFEVSNCFYGKRGASLSLGLYLNKNKNGLKKGTLLMLYTFGMNFFGKNKNMLEVLRVGTLKKSYVIGGASKLLKHFVQNYEIVKVGGRDVKVETLKFYSDYDHNLGGSMSEVGFKFHSYSKGGFMNYWKKSGEVRHRQPMQHKWVMDQIKQKEAFSIPNAGVKTFLLDIKEYKKTCK